MFRFQSRQSGIAIALVLVALMVGMGVVALYFTTVRSQRKFDTLYEQDLRAYYLSESGFQYSIGKLSESRRYEERWYQPSLSVSLKQEFRYTGQSAHGVFQTYLSQINENKEFSHLFLLSKGIYFSGKIQRDGARERVIALIKGNLAYSPKPPSEDEQVLFVIDKSPLNHTQLMELILDPKLKHLFAVDNGVIPSKIRSLIEFLKTNKLEDIDFASEPALMQGIAELDRLNQKIKNLKRLSLSIRTKVNNSVENQYFPEQAPLNTSISFLSDLNLKPFEDLVASGKNIDQLFDLFGRKMIPLSNLRKANLLGNETLNLLKYLPPITRVTFGSKLDGLSNKQKEISIDQFRTLISKKSKNFEDIKALLDTDVSLVTPLTQAFKIKDIFNVSGLSKLIKTLGNPNLLDHSDKTLDRNLSAQAPVSEEEVSAEEVSSVVDDQSKENEDLLSEDILRSGDPYSLEERERILNHLYQPVFEDIKLGEQVYDDNLANGFLKIFMNSLSDQLHEFALKIQLLWDRDPTPEEYERFKEENSIPSREAISKVGNILDVLFKSNEYTFHHGANVLKSNSYNTSGGIYTVVERQPETMHTELQNKLTTYYFTHGAKTDQQFLDMFKKSTWGDSSSANSISKSAEFYASKHKTDYFIRHKTTGKEIKLFDYITSQM